MVAWLAHFGPTVARIENVFVLAGMSMANINLQPFLGWPITTDRCHEGR